MYPKPIFDNPHHKGNGKSKGKAAAIAFVKEGASVVIAYYNEHQNVFDTKEYIENSGEKCLLLSRDISNHDFCQFIVD